jgi:Uma2 family endonuclease
MITTQSTGPPPSVEWLPSQLYRLTVEQYELLVRSGVFKSRDRFHLINGLLVRKMVKNPPHSIACGLADDELVKVFGPGWHARLSEPVRIPPKSEPEPDVMMVRGQRRDYLAAHPGPADLAMVVEVADSSLADDRKMALVYGPAGIPVYWIVNLVDRQVEVYAGPHAGGYAPPVIYQPGSAVPVVIDGVTVGTIAVDDLLP